MGMMESEGASERGCKIIAAEEFDLPERCDLCEILGLHVAGICVECRGKV